jgi:LmbE family N-acetylglucosaminyl deacetylase
VRPPALRVARALLWLRSRPGPPVGAGEIVVIAPHPDDAELGCAGLIGHVRGQGRRVTIVCVTDGTGSHPGHPTVTPDALGALRRDEARAAAALLGVAPAHVTFLGASDGQLATLDQPARQELAARLAGVFTTGAVAAVFLPYRHDHSSEHEALFSIVQAALRSVGSTARLFEYPVWAAWNPRFLAAAALARHRVWRFALGELHSLKRQAVALHQSQIAPTPPWDHPVLPPGFARCFDGPNEYFFEG